MDPNAFANFQGYATTSEGNIYAANYHVDAVRQYGGGFVTQNFQQPPAQPPPPPPQQSQSCYQVSVDSTTANWFTYPQHQTFPNQQNQFVPDSTLTVVPNNGVPQFTSLSIENPVPVIREGQYANLPQQQQCEGYVAQQQPLRQEEQQIAFLVPSQNVISASHLPSVDQTFNSPIAETIVEHVPSQPKILVGRGSTFKSATDQRRTTAESPVAYGVVSSSQRSTSKSSTPSPIPSPIATASSTNTTPRLVAASTTKPAKRIDVKIEPPDAPPRDKRVATESSYHFCSFCNKPFGDEEKCRAHEKASHLNSRPSGENLGVEEGNGIDEAKSAARVKTSVATASSAKFPLIVATPDTATPGSTVPATSTSNTATSNILSSKRTNNSTKAGPLSKKRKITDEARKSNPEAPPQSCVFCGRNDFCSESELFDHLKRVHELMVSQDKTPAVEGQGASVSSFSCSIEKCGKKDVKLEKQAFAQHMESNHYVRIAKWSEPDGSTPSTFRCMACKMAYVWKFVNKHVTNSMHLANVARLVTTKTTGQDGKEGLSDTFYSVGDDVDSLATNVVMYEKESNLKNLLQAPMSFSCPACPPPTNFHGEYDLKVHIIKNHKGFFPSHVVQTFAPGLVKIAKNFGYDVQIPSDPNMIVKARSVERDDSKPKPGPLSKKMNQAVPYTKTEVAGSSTNCTNPNPDPNTSVKEGPISRKSGPPFIPELSSSGVEGFSGKSVSAISSLKPLSQKPGPRSSKAIAVSPDDERSQFHVPYKSPVGLPFAPVGMAHKCTWKCNACGDVVSHRNNAKRHSIAMHDGVPDYTLLVDGKAAATRHDQYRCNICCVDFESSRALQEHASKEHEFKNVIAPADQPASSPKQVPGFKPTVGSGFEKSGGFLCPKCPNRNFISEYALHCHSNRAHKAEEIVPTGEKGAARCEDCDLGFSTYANLRRHMKTQHKLADKKYECSFCKKEFWDLSNGRRHLTSHEEAASLLVRPVNQALSAEEDAEEGGNPVLVEEEPSKKNVEDNSFAVPEFKCDKCNLGFPYESMLLLHYRRKHSDLLQTKKKSSPSKSRHVSSAQQNIPSRTTKANGPNIDSQAREMSYADAALRKKFGLNKKLKISASKVRTFSCRECPKILLSGDALQRHFTHAHKVAKRMNCKDCEQIFTNHHCFKRHQNLVHTKGDITKFFSCPICNEGFDNRAGLSSHLSSNYNVNISKWLAHQPNKGISFRCKTCNDQFSFSDLAQHVSTHNGEDSAWEDDSNGNVGRVTTKISGAARGVCMVCGQGDSGWHHGAIACDACRKFFSSAVEKQKTLTCEHNGKCEVSVKSRSCASCRFDKCYSVGMNIGSKRPRPQSRSDTSYTLIAEVITASPKEESKKVEQNFGASFSLIENDDCCICGKSGVSQHYGVKCCDPCRMFFRNIAINGKVQSLACREDGACEITETSRSCAYCRYQKCLLKGMDLDIPVSRQSSVPAAKINIETEVDASTSKSLSKTLPLKDAGECAVCGHTQSYIYHGVRVCHPCRMFFFNLVQYKKVSSLTCKGSKECPVTVTSRSCSYCRYQKCLDVKMRVTAETSRAQDQVSKKLPIAANDEMQVVQCSVCLNDAEDVCEDVPCCRSCRTFYKQYKDQVLNLYCSKSEKCKILYEKYSHDGCKLCRIERCLTMWMGRKKAETGLVIQSPKEISKPVQEKRKKKSQCSVCSTYGDGVAYGVSCCDSCRYFFCKSQKEGLSQFTCNEDGSCNMKDPEYFGKRCRLCRISKCFEVGMGKTDIAVPVSTETTTKSSKSDVIMQPSPGPQSTKDEICRICWRPAVGTFYGVRSCLRCKNCFMRASRNGSNSTCKNDESCDLLDQGQRTSCQHCLIKQCVRMGMVRDEEQKNDNDGAPSTGAPSARKSVEKMCQVCYSDSTGIHYNVETCNGCRVFFSANEEKLEEFKCRHNEDCEKKSVIQLKNCRYCRLKKCLRVGMSKTIPVVLGSNLEITIIKSPDESANGASNEMCVICNNAVGERHYGVICCDRCRETFRKNVDLFDKIRCREDSSCQLKDPPYCKFCVINKCIEKGMKLRKDGFVYKKLPTTTSVSTTKAMDTLLAEIYAKDDGPLRELKMKINSVKRSSGHLAGYKSTKEFQKCLILFKMFGRLMGGVASDSGLDKAKALFERNLNEFASKLTNLNAAYKKRMSFGTSRRLLGIYLKSQALNCFLAERKRHEPDETSPGLVPGTMTRVDKPIGSCSGKRDVSSPKMVSVSSVKIDNSNNDSVIKTDESLNSRDTNTLISKSDEVRETRPEVKSPFVSHRSSPTMRASLCVIHALIDTIVVDGDENFYKQCVQLRESRPQTPSRVCSFCSEDGFEGEDQLDLHRRLFHAHERSARSKVEIVSVENSPEANSSPREHECDECGASFRYKDSLSKHKKTRHFSKPKKSVLACPICRKTYNSKSFLETHLEAIHGGKSTLERSKWACPCDSYYYSKEHFLQHLLYGHGMRVSKWKSRNKKQPHSVRCYACSQHYMWEFMLDHLNTDIHKFFSTYFNREPRVVLERIVDVDKYLADYRARTGECRAVLSSILDSVEWKVDVVENGRSLNDGALKRVSTDASKRIPRSRASSVGSEDDFFSCESVVDLETDEWCEADNGDAVADVTASSANSLAKNGFRKASSVKCKDSSSSTPKNLTCERCGVVFSHRSNLYRHIRNKTCR